MLKVLYEDNHVIAVFKPAGVLSQADVTGDKSIIDQIKRYLKEKYKKPGNVFLGLVQRLDRPVCGIMLFAKTSKGASRLSEQFRNQQIEKTYQAIVIGRPEKSRSQSDRGSSMKSGQRGMLKNKLIKDEKLHKGREHADGQEVTLHYEIIKSNKDHSLLKIKIEGGKFHQIRSQLSLAGFPILGDIKYGAKEPLVDKSIALCATDISFWKATGEEKITLSIPVPEHWNEFIV